MRIRLTAPCQIDGAMRDAGYETTLPDGVRGPHRTLHSSPDLINYDPSDGLDANRISGDAVDVPLFEVIDGSTGTTIDLPRDDRETKPKPTQDDINRQFLAMMMEVRDQIAQITKALAMMTDPFTVIDAEPSRAIEPISREN